MSNLYGLNREKFFNLMDDFSAAIIFSGTAPLRHGDEIYPFCPQKNFYYLTGIDEPNLALVLVKRGNVQSATLFLERFDELNAKWIGKVLDAKEAQEISGIDKFKYIDELNTVTQGFFGKMTCEKIYFDLQKFFWGTEESKDIKYANEIRQKYPQAVIVNAYSMFAKLRMIKSEQEIAHIQKAVDITNESFKEIVSHAKPGVYEYELEAYHDFTVKKNGTRTSFATIACAGANATVLHYVNNNSLTKDGDMLLLDFGAGWKHYSADITRTFPLNGKFSDRQKQLYNIVLEANQRVIAAAKPGLPFKRLNEIVLEFYDEKLREIGLIEKKEQVANYYYHGVSHHLGLETHDASYMPGDAVLEEGMVFTVEPGLYIAQEGIGIRIEDDVLITAEGNRVLSKDIIKTVDEIEEFMKNR